MAPQNTNRRKAPPALIATFVTMFPGPPAERRLAFGNPAALVNGRLFMGLHEEDMILRLGTVDRAALLKMEGARIFELNPGRAMTDYVVVPRKLLANRKALKEWVDKAFAHTKALKETNRPFTWG